MSANAKKVEVKGRKIVFSFVGSGKRIPSELFAVSKMRQERYGFQQVPGDTAIPSSSQTDVETFLASLEDAGYSVARATRHVDYVLNEKRESKPRWTVTFEFVPPGANKASLGEEVLSVVRNRCREGYFSVVVYDDLTCAAVSANARVARVDINGPVTTKAIGTDGQPTGARVPLPPKNVLIYSGDQITVESVV